MAKKSKLWSGIVKPFRKLFHKWQRLANAFSRVLATNKIPEHIVKEFEYWLGVPVDSSKIICLPDDGNAHYAHGKFDIFVFRRGETVYKVFSFEDGYLEFR